jgi:hypothetical protein
MNGLELLERCYTSGLVSIPMIFMWPARAATIQIGIIIFNLRRSHMRPDMVAVAPDGAIVSFCPVVR